MPSLTIKRRLQLLMIVALVPLVGACLYISKNSAADYQASLKVPEVLAYAGYLGDLTHELQKERGLSAGFISSGGKTFGTKLSEQRQLTDGIAVAIDDRLASCIDAEICSAEQVDDLKNQLTSLSKLRSATDRLEPAKGILGTYTSIVRYSLTSASDASYAVNSSRLTKELISARALAQAKEFAGLERAKVSQALSGNEIADSLKMNIASLRRAQVEQIDLCCRLLPSDECEEINSIAVSENSKLAATIVGAVLESADSKSAGYTPQEWWGVQTKKLGQYRKVQNLLDQAIASEATSVKRNSFAALLTVCSLGFVSVATVICFGFVTIRTISKRTHHLADAVLRIAQGKADLSERLHEDDDELGEIAANFNKVMERLQQAGNYCGESTIALSERSVQVSNSAEAIAGQIRDSQSRSEQIVVASSEMRGTIRDVSETIETVTGSLGSASQTIGQLAVDMNEANQVASEASRQSESASAIVEQNSQKINELTNAAKEIGDVVELIQDIAEQTNLLSLNATIEAARAGEAGKGFAVVANEVKELAGQTGSAISSIRERVDSIQSASNATSESISEIGAAFEGLRRSTSGMAEKSVRYGESANRLRDEIRALCDESQQARSSIDRTVSQTDEVNEHLDLIEKALRASAEGVGETHSEGVQLRTMAETMRSNMEEMLSCS